MDPYEDAVVPGLVGDGSDSQGPTEQSDAEVMNRLRLVEPGEVETTPGTVPNDSYHSQAERDAYDPEEQPQSLEQLVEHPGPPDPFERHGFDTQRANEIAAGAALSVPDYAVSHFMQAWAESGLEGEDGFRQFCARAKQAVDMLAEREAERARVDALEARLQEREERGPGSPLDDRLSRIEQMLAGQREQEQAIAAQEQYLSQRIPLQSSGFEMIAAEAQRRGLAVPDPQAAAQIGAQLMHLEPMLAARLAWLGAGGDSGVFGPRRGVDKPYHPTANREGRVIHRGEVRSDPVSLGPGRPDRSLDDLLQGETDEMDSTIEKFYQGGS